MTKNSRLKNTTMLSSTNSCSKSSINQEHEKPKSALPGPSGLPCIGSMLDWKGPQTNLEWTRQYGAIYHVKMGGKDLVYLNTLSLVKKHLEGRKGDVFLDRLMGPAAVGEGLLFGSGQTWQKNKRAMMKALHTQTFLPKLESAVLSETRLVLETMYAHCEKGRRSYIKPGDLLLQACANAVAGLLCGGNLAEGSKDRKDLARVARDLQGCDLSSMLTQISLKHPKLREPLSKVLFTDIVDVYGTSRLLQRLLRQWIRQARSGTLTPTPTNAKPFPRFMSAEPKPKTSWFSDDVAEDDGDSSSGIQRKCPRLEHSENTEISDSEIEETSESGFSEETDGSLNSSRQFSSEESLLAAPRDESLIEQAMRNATQLAVFGFSETARGEMPYEATVPPAASACPHTPLVQSQWVFQREMSVNPGEDSILQRVLQQPEFEHVMEDNDAELLQTLIDMFFGGVTSTLSAVEFVLYYLTQNPMMQDLAQKEIDSVLAKTGSNDDIIVWEMRAQMPYVRGCITEALRMGSVTPSSLPHVAIKDAEIEGFNIPAGTLVLGSIISLHRDPAQYLDADVFRPQRHLKPDGEFHQPESYRPYGMGARRCAGEQIAEVQLFIYTANILRRFNLKPTGSKKFDSSETHMRIIHRLKDFRCILERRTV